MSIRVLITGANGFIGRNLLKSIDNADYEIIPIVRNSAGLKREIVADICDVAFGPILEKIPRCDMIVHQAARVSWRDNEKNAIFNSNALPSAILADWAYKNGSYYIFTSTATVYGARSAHISENNILNTDTDYSYSKWLAEELIKFSGAHHAILRMGGVFGLDGPGHLGINTAIRNALAGIIPVINGDGKEKRNYIYVKDICQIIKYFMQERIGGTYIVAGNHVNTIEEMLADIADILMNGKEPMHEMKRRGNDQIIDASPFLPKCRPFRKAIEDIKNDYVKEKAHFQRIDK